MLIAEDDTFIVWLRLNDFRIDIDHAGRRLLIVDGIVTVDQFIE